MQHALTLAQKGIWTTAPNPCVGCVIVKNERIIGQGYHAQAGAPHAEVFALKQAGDGAKGASLYVTLEPCSHYGRTPPCVNAIIQAGITAVFIAHEDPNPQVSGQGIQQLREAGIQVHIGCLEKQARQLNAGFMTRMTRSRPWIRIKLASSIDGRTALANGKSQWITQNKARADVQSYRAQSDAILTGADTILADDPALNVRLHELPTAIATQLSQTHFRQPWRFFTDSHHRVPLNANIYQHQGQVIRLCTHDQEHVKVEENHWFLPKTPTAKIDLQAFVQQLGIAQCNNLWVESGATLAGALIEQKLFDEIILYLAPKLIGHTGRPLVHLPEIQHIQETIELNIKDIQLVGEDIKIVFTCDA